MTSAVTTRKSPWKKIALTGAVLVGAGALVGTGAFAFFTSTDTATTTVDAGQLDVSITDVAVASDIAPGDTVERTIPIVLPGATNDGDLVASIDFSAAVSAETLGTSFPGGVAGGGASIVGGTDGLTYTLQNCLGGTWTTSTTPTGPYSCVGGTVTTIDSGKLSALSTATNFTPVEAGLPAGTTVFPSDTGAGYTLNTLLTLVLPTTADNNYENASADLTFTATAIQRAGIQK